MQTIPELIFTHTGNSLGLTLLYLGGLFWIITYILSIRTGFNEMTYAIPMMAFVLNFSWEATYGFLITQHQPPVQLIINKIWSGIDLIIIFTYLRYGKKYFPSQFSALFYPNFILALIIAFIFQYTSYYYFYVENVIPYPSGTVAYLMNLLMSILFIMMLQQRKSTEGQSIYIAAAKLLGTLLTSLSLICNPEPGHWMRAGFVIYFLAVATFIYDLIYLLLLFWQFKLEGKNPWRKI